VQPTDDAAAIAGLVRSFFAAFTSGPDSAARLGADLNAVVDERISLPELLHRKHQHAARTGEVFISVYTLLG
jgi:hypothetical protein